MKSTGIRIEGEKESIGLSVSLFDVLQEIHNGEQYHWTILDIDAIMHPKGVGPTLFDIVEGIKNSTNGYSISWAELNDLSHRFHQIIWITILGCKDQTFLQYYENDPAMYTACDIVLDIFDGAWWEIFSKDANLIDRLAINFQNVTRLETDFHEKGL